MPIPVARQRWSWVVYGAAALAIVGASVLFRRQPASLAPPDAVPGLLEFAAVGVARAAHAAPIGAWILRANDGVLVVAVALFLALARRCGIGWLAAVSVSLAFAVSASFDPTLAPLPPAGVACAAVSYLALARAGRGSSLRDGLLAAAALALTALVEPRLGIALALLAAWVAARSTTATGAALRLSAALAGAAIVLLPVLALDALMPRLPPGLGAGEGHMWLARALTRSWKDGLDAGWHVFIVAGPLAVALAAFGAFTRRSMARAGSAPPLLFALTPVIVAVPLGNHGARWLAPALVGFWILAAMGVDEFSRNARRRFSGAVVAVLLAILLPLLRVARPPIALPSESVPRGHERVSLDDFKRLAAALPDGAIVVHDDEVGDLLLRALDGTWQRMGKALRAEVADAPTLLDVARAGKTTIFALPAAQTRLPSLGFLLADADIPGVSGLAKVQAGGACSVVDQAWRDLAALTTTSSFAMVSGDRRWEGPVVLYAESRHRLDAAPHQWPGTTDRGFGGRTFSRSAVGDRALLDQAVRDDGFLAEGFSAGATDIVRLELWHPPEAPRILVVDLSDRPIRVVARVGSPSAPQALMICPVFAFEPRGF